MKYLKFALVFFSCSFSQAAEISALQAEDAKMIIEEFLNLSDPKLNDIQQMQKRSKVFSNYLEAAKKGRPSAVKVVLFYAYLTPEIVGARAGALRSSLVPIFEKSPDVVLAALRDVHLLRKPVCMYLSQHFGFEDNPVSGRKAFLNRHRAKIKNQLGPASTDCLSRFKE